MYAGVVYVQLPLSMPRLPNPRGNLAKQPQYVS